VEINLAADEREVTKRRMKHETIDGRCCATRDKVRFTCYSTRERLVREQVPGVGMDLFLSLCLSLDRDDSL
jgi:hypothetical protein